MNTLFFILRNIVHEIQNITDLSKYIVLRRVQSLQPRNAFISISTYPDPEYSWALKSPLRIHFTQNKKHNHKKIFLLFLIFLESPILFFISGHQYDRQEAWVRHYGIRIT